MNSYHHQSDSPRYRIVVPIELPLTLETYELLFDNVAKKILEAGYQHAKDKNVNGKKVWSGLDFNKRPPDAVLTTTASVLCDKATCSLCF